MFVYKIQIFGFLLNYLKSDVIFFIIILLSLDVFISYFYIKN